MDLKHYLMGRKTLDANGSQILTNGSCVSGTDINKTCLNRNQLLTVETILSKWKMILGNEDRQIIFTGTLLSGLRIDEAVRYCVVKCGLITSDSKILSIVEGITHILNV